MRGNRHGVRNLGYADFPESWVHGVPAVPRPERKRHQIRRGRHEVDTPDRVIARGGGRLDAPAGAWNVDRAEEALVQAPRRPALNKRFQLGPRTRVLATALEAQ